MSNWGLVAAMILGCSSAAPVSALCCGDCDADGRVAIDELIGAVTLALDGCPAAAPALVLQHVALPSLEAALAADATAGRLALALDTAWAGADQDDRLLFAIRGRHRFDNRVELVKTGGFLRWIVTDAGGREADASVAISAWSPGRHSLVATWGDGRATLAVDGQPIAQNDTGALRLRAGDRIQIGSPDHSDTTFASVVLTTAAAPAPAGGH